MSLAEIMLEQIAVARRIVEDGHEVLPAWRITTPEGSYLVLTRFDTDKPQQRERALMLIGRFMVWKMATSFVLTAETWLGAASACPWLPPEVVAILLRVEAADDLEHGPCRQYAFRPVRCS